METTPFIIERTFSAAADHVWQAITDPHKMKQWYFDVQGFKAEPGCEFSFYGGSEECNYLHLCRVLEVIPGKKLVYTWRYDGLEGDSTVTWELIPAGEKTLLRLTHEGLETFPQHDKNFRRDSFNQGWNDFFDASLKKFLEKNND